MAWGATDRGIEDKWPFDEFQRKTILTGETRTFLLFREVAQKGPPLPLGQLLQLSLKVLLQSQLLLSARLRGVDDVLIVAAALGADPQLLDADVAENVVGALDALLAAPGALGRLRKRFVLAVPAKKSDS